MAARETPQSKRALRNISSGAHRALPGSGLTGLTAVQEVALRLQRQIGNRATIQISRAIEEPQATSVRERMTRLYQNGLAAEPTLKGAASEEQKDDEQKTAEAFRSSTFYYGTTGDDAGKSALKQFLDKVNKREKKGPGKALPFYWPGDRAMEYLADRGGRGAMGANAATPATATSPAYPASPEIKAAAGRGEPAQMMDMYYGMEGQQLHELRNPQIGKYVHEKMGYKGAYDQHKPGRDAYMEKYSVGQFAGLEGWQFPQRADDKKNGDGTKNDYPRALFRNPLNKKEALSGTMEISRFIRDGIFKYGGTLIFENRNVFNEGSFLSGVRQGDTNKEAVALFPFFAKSPGQSRVPFGAGTLIFHHGGKETVPTQWGFRQFWAWPGTRLTAKEAEKLIPPKSPFWSFPVGISFRDLAREGAADARSRVQAANPGPPPTTTP